MEATQSFESGLQVFCEKLERLDGVVGALRILRDNFAQEPVIQEMLLKRGRFEEMAKRLEEDISQINDKIKRKLEFLDLRRRALTDKKVRNGFSERLTKRKKVLAQFKSYKETPDSLILESERLVWEIEAPIAEVERVFNRCIEEEKSKEHGLKSCLEETLKSISKINDCFHNTKKSLKDLIFEMELERSQILAAKRDWQDSYRAKLPNESLPGLASERNHETVVKGLPYAVRKKPECDSAVEPKSLLESAKIQPKVWEFFLTFSENELGRQMPQDREQFLQILKIELRKVGYENIRCRRLYEGLMSVTNKSLQERLQMEEVFRSVPRNWKKLKGGKNHRVFLDIDEEKMQIRFWPCPRSKAYKKQVKR